MDIVFVGVKNGTFPTAEELVVSARRQEHTFYCLDLEDVLTGPEYRPSLVDTSKSADQFQGNILDLVSSPQMSFATIPIPSRVASAAGSRYPKGNAVNPAQVRAIPDSIFDQALLLFENATKQLLGSRFALTAWAVRCLPMHMSPSSRLSYRYRFADLGVLFQEFQYHSPYDSSARKTEIHSWLGDVISVTDLDNLIGLVPHQEAAPELLANLAEKFQDLLEKDAKHVSQIEGYVHPSYRLSDEDFFTHIGSHIGMPEEPRRQRDEPSQNTKAQYT